MLVKSIWKQSMDHMKTAKEMLQTVPRSRIGFFPTPLHRLNNISNDLGVNLYIKRDDMTGVNLFGGNKVRKLEFLIGYAKEHGYDTVFTFGATQSNHAMETASMCNAQGLKSILYLVDLTEQKEERPKANLLLDMILGAEVHIIPANGREEAEADLEAEELCRKQVEQMEKEGHKCFVIPEGGANYIGSTGFINGYAEMLEQMAQLNEKPDYIFHATGTGGTLAGLAAGRALLESDASIYSVTVSPKELSHLEKVANIANESLRYIGSDKTVLPSDMHYELSYYGEGYEKPTKEATEAIQYLARKEGIIVDPVYTGKAFSGMLDCIRSEKIPQGSTVVFWHTGGATGIFAEPEIVGEIWK